MVSFLYVVALLFKIWPITTAYSEHYFTWIQSGFLQIGFDLFVDRLTAVMLLIVTGVGLLIHIYSHRVHGSMRAAITASSATSICSCSSC